MSVTLFGEASQFSNWLQQLYAHQGMIRNFSAAFESALRANPTIAVFAVEHQELAREIVSFCERSSANPEVSTAAGHKPKILSPNGEKEESGEDQKTKSADHEEKEKGRNADQQTATQPQTEPPKPIQPTNTSLSMPNVPEHLKQISEEFITVIQIIQKIKNFQEILRQHLSVFQEMLKQHYETQQK